MFDIGWPEIVVIAIVAIVVIGPRDLPKAFYTVGKWVRAARRVTSDFQRHVDDMVRETELEDLKKVANQARGLNVKNQIEKAIDPTGDITGDFKSALDIDTATGGKPGPSSSPSTPVAPGNSIATPSVSTPPVSTPVETKAEPATTAAKPAAKKPAAHKPSPRVASRVPKRTAAKPAPKTSSKAASKPAAKTPNPEKTS